MLTGKHSSVVGIPQCVRQTQQFSWLTDSLRRHFLTSFICFYSGPFPYVCLKYTVVLDGLLQLVRPFSLPGRLGTTRSLSKLFQGEFLFDSFLIICSAVSPQLHYRHLTVIKQPSSSSLLCDHHLSPPRAPWPASPWEWEGIITHMDCQTASIPKLLSLIILKYPLSAMPLFTNCHECYSS